MNGRLALGEQQISLAPKPDGTWRLGATDVTDVEGRMSTTFDQVHGVEIEFVLGGIRYRCASSGAPDEFDRATGRFRGVVFVHSAEAPPPPPTLQTPPR